MLYGWKPTLVFLALILGLHEGSFQILGAEYDQKAPIGQGSGTTRRKVRVATGPKGARFIAESDYSNVVLEADKAKQDLDRLSVRWFQEKLGTFANNTTDVFHGVTYAEHTRYETMVLGALASLPSGLQREALEVLKFTILLRYIKVTFSLSKSWDEALGNFLAYNLVDGGRYYLRKAATSLMLPVAFMRFFHEIWGYISPGFVAVCGIGTYLFPLLYSPSCDPSKPGGCKSLKVYNPDSFAQAEASGPNCQDASHQTNQFLGNFTSNYTTFSILFFTLMMAIPDFHGQAYALEEMYINHFGRLSHDERNTRDTLRKIGTLRRCFAGRCLRPKEKQALAAKDSRGSIDQKVHAVRTEMKQKVAAMVEFLRTHDEIYLKEEVSYGEIKELYDAYLGFVGSAK